MLSVEEATQRVLSAFAPIGCETVPVSAGLGRVLAEPVIARLTQPPGPVSAMDGYALRAADIATLPARLGIAMRIAAGQAPDRALKPGEAARIFTGALLPEGADTVVIQENCDATTATVTIREGSNNRGQHVRAAGLDFAEGSTGIAAGRLLSARDIGLAAAMNWPWLKVRRRPLVAVLGTGDELSHPGEKLGPAQIVGSNSLALSAFVSACGGEAIDLGIARDTEADIGRAIDSAAGCDVLVTTGGASVGEHDLVPPALARRGMKLDFWKIAMRPGKPLMFGQLGAMRVLGLPGNPVSALVTATLFLRPAIDRMLGVTDAIHANRRAQLACDLRANDFRQDYLRARLTQEGGRAIAHPFDIQDSSMLSLIARADCLIVRPPKAPPARTGDEVEIIPLSGGHLSI